MNTASQRDGGCALRQSVLHHDSSDRVGIGHALIDNCSAQEACVAIIEYAKAGGRPADVTCTVCAESLGECGAATL